MDGPFIGPDAKFDPSVNNVTLRCSPRIEFKEDLKNISVIVAGTEEGLPTITKVVDVATGSENLRITPGGGCYCTGTGTHLHVSRSNTSLIHVCAVLFLHSTYGCTPSKETKVFVSSSRIPYPI